MTMTLRTLPALAADYIDTHGWTQGTGEDDQGRVCLTGALRRCSPQPGDFALARGVFRARDRAEEWNDKDGRTAREVTAYLRATEITDADLTEVFGPQWREIAAIVRRAAALTKDESDRLHARRYVWSAALIVDELERLDAAQNAARNAARLAATGAPVGYAALEAVEHAAGAVSVRDLIGQHGLTQDHYDTLTRPWADVIGKVHPND